MNGEDEGERFMAECLLQLEGPVWGRKKPAGGAVVGVAAGVKKIKGKGWGAWLASASGEKKLGLRFFLCFFSNVSKLLPPCEWVGNSYL